MDKASLLVVLRKKRQKKQQKNTELDKNICLEQYLTLSRCNRLRRSEACSCLTSPSFVQKSTFRFFRRCGKKSQKKKKEMKKERKSHNPELDLFCGVSLNPSSCK